MSLPTPTLLVRHGRDYLDSGLAPGHLSPAGEQHAREAAAALALRGLGESAIILTTRAHRTIETGATIAKKLGAQVIEGSSTFTRISNLPVGLESLDALLEEELAAAGLCTDSDAMSGGLIVVCNSPLIAGAKGMDVSSGSDGRIPHGSVTEYTPGSWVTPRS